MKPHRNGGFTIIEILVAIALLGILTAVLTGTLTGSLGLNRQSQKQLSTAAGAQDWLEEIRKSWVSQANYDSACVKGKTLPTGYKIEFINLGTRAELVDLTNTLTTAPTAYNIEFVSDAAGTCGAQPGDLLTPAAGSPTPPAMRRIVVKSGKAGGTAGGWVQDAQDTTLSLDILRPLP